MDSRCRPRHETSEPWEEVMVVVLHTSFFTSLLLYSWTQIFVSQINPKLLSLEKFQDYRKEGRKVEVYEAAME